MCCWTFLTHPIPHFTLSSPPQLPALPIHYVSSFEAYLNGLLSFPYFSILVLLSGTLFPDINFIVMIPLLVSCWESFPVWLPWFLCLEGAQRDTFWPCRWTWINIKCMKRSQRYGDICFVKWTLLEAVGLCWETKGEMRPSLAILVIQYGALYLMENIPGVIPRLLINNKGQVIWTEIY